jgi:hypothetical protein
LEFPPSWLFRSFYVGLLLYGSSIHDPYYFRVNKGKPNAKNIALYPAAHKEAQKENGLNSQKKKRGGPARLAHHNLCYLTREFQIQVIYS